MSEPGTAAATARRRADSEHKRQRVLTVAGAWVDRGQDFCWEQLARAAQVNPGFVHRALGLKAEVEALRQEAALELEAGLRAGTAVTMASVTSTGSRGPSTPSHGRRGATPFWHLHGHRRWVTGPSGRQGDAYGSTAGHAQLSGLPG